MNRKFSLIPLALVILVGAVWAGSMITPDKAGFPSMPNTAGTLGYILEVGRFFRGDGTALNGNTLAGISTNGYLKGGNCPATTVWKGTDAAGNIICAAKSRILAGVGRITVLGGSVSTILEEGGTSKTAAIGDVLKEGSRVITAAGGSATITFTDEQSIMRLDQNTRVDITLAGTTTPANTSIATVIANNGVIWGRVLTTAGIEFGGGGLIAGVRGTSISLESRVPNQFRLVIPHSRDTTGNAARLKAGDMNRNIAKQQMINYASGITVISPSIVLSKALTYLYGQESSSPTDIKNQTGPWILKNTVADLLYLTGQLERTPQVIAEYLATKPNNTKERRELCFSPTGGSTNNGIFEDLTGCVFGYADSTTGWKMRFGSSNDVAYGSGEWMGLAHNNSKKRDDNDIRDKGNTYGALLNYNQLLGGGDPANTQGRQSPTRPFRYAKFQTVLDIIFTTGSSCPVSKRFCNFLRNEGIGSGYIGTIVEAIPDHTTFTESEWSDKSYTYQNIYLVKDEPKQAIVNNPANTNINSNGQYLQYLGEDGPTLSRLAGKTITIELGGAVGSGRPTGWTKAYIADFGSEKWFVSNNINCAGTATTGRFLCKQGNIESTPYANGLSISLQLTNTPTQFIIGNQFNPAITNHLQNPIGSTIQKVIIQ